MLLPSRRTEERGVLARGRREQAMVQQRYTRQALVAKLEQSKTSGWVLSSEGELNKIDDQGIEVSIE